MLSHANKKKKKVLIASTSEVYGKSTDVPFREDGDLVLGATTKGRWSYACSKAIDEFLALAYHKERKLPVVVFRLFNTVGPRQTGRYGMVIPNFVQQALCRPAHHGVRRRPAEPLLHLRGRRGGRARRSSSEIRAAIGQVFNIGNDREEISIMRPREADQGSDRSRPARS